MFSRYVVDIDESFFSVNIEEDNKDLDYYYKLGKNHIKKYKEEIDLSLEKYTRKHILSADKIEKEWFPQVKVDVFLSHSRKDKKVTIALAGWLHEKFGLKCFVDSLVWNHADSLLKLLNNNYSDKEDDDYGKVYYSHNKCCKVSEHVNMILAIALLKMIDTAETVFLVNAGHSINFIVDEGIDVTYSPWIFSEIMYVKLIRRKPLFLYRDYEKPFRVRKKNMLLLESMIMQFPVDLNGIEHINDKLMIIWDEKSEKKKDYPLDVLYDMTCYKNEMQITHEIYEFVPQYDIDTVREIYAKQTFVNPKLNVLIMENLFEKNGNDWISCPLCGRGFVHEKDE